MNRSMMMLWCGLLSFWLLPLACHAQGRGGRSSSSTSRNTCHVAHCWGCEWTSRYRCSSCYSGYTVEPMSGKCYPCAQNCYSCAVPDTCDVCSTGYVLTDPNICEPSSAGCRLCHNTTPLGCTDCSGYLGWKLQLQSEGGSCAFSWHYVIGWWGLRFVLLVVAAYGLYAAFNYRSGPSNSRRKRHMAFLLAKEAGAARPLIHGPGGSGRAAVALREPGKYPNGPWKGYYTQRGLQHAGCKLHLEFHNVAAAGIISGVGVDDVGCYSIQGRYGARGAVAFTKNYWEGTKNVHGVIQKHLNQGHSVEYRGTAVALRPDGVVDIGRGIRGDWEFLDGTEAGTFHLWPVMEGWQEPEDEEGPAEDDGVAFYAADDEHQECCICYDRRINCRLEPCRHVAFCTVCAHAARLCPLCRVLITRRVPLQDRSARARPSESDAGGRGVANRATRRQHLAPLSD